MHGWMHERMYERMDGCMKEWMDGCMKEWMEWKNGWLGRMDGNREIEGRIKRKDGWTDGMEG